MNYPKDRPACYIAQINRALFESGAAAKMTPRAVGLILYVAGMEDKLFYSEPVKLKNGNLKSVLGVSSDDTVNNIRNAAIKAGWLAYKGSGTRQDGLYYTKIPESIAPDNRSNEPLITPGNRSNEPLITPGNRSNEPLITPGNRNPPKPKTIPKREIALSEVEGGQVIDIGLEGDSNSLSVTSSLIEEIHSGSEREDRPSSSDVVKQFARTLNEDDYLNAESQAVKFFDYWEERDWIRGKGKGKTPIKSWKKTFRTWVGYEKKGASTPATVTDPHQDNTVPMPTFTSRG